MNAGAANGNGSSKSIFPWLNRICEPDAIYGHPYMPAAEDCYPKGAYTFQIMGGYYTNLGSTNYSYAVGSFRIGKILDFGIEEGFLRGYFEPIVEINAAPTFGIGSAFVGATSILRYNFVQPEWRFVPYAQIGFGLQYNNAYQTSTQNALGQALEYTGQAQVGVHYFLTHSVSLDVEAGYEMISNLGQSSRNGGINAIGGSIGLTYYFPCGLRR
jgi:hypothetical protein